jgi:hypothetical protein
VSREGRKKKEEGRRKEEGGRKVGAITVKYR